MSKVQCLLWLEFEVKKLDVAGKEFGLYFSRAFSVNREQVRTDKVEIYDVYSFDEPVLVSVGEWTGHKWILREKYHKKTHYQKICSIFEICSIPYSWIR